MKLKVIDPRKIPHEVWWVICLPEYIGHETYQKSRDIIAKYPEYFPWETKYDSIPKEVHEEYSKEAHPWLFEPLKLKGGGITELIGKHTYDPTALSDFTMEDFNKLCQDIENDRIAKNKAKVEQFKKDKALWDKHYKKYGLEYRTR